MTTYIPQLTLPKFVLSNPAASILLPIGLGTAVGYGVSISETQNLYRIIKNPPGRPPSWLFGPVWTVLYGLMGYAAHRAQLIADNPLSTPTQVSIAQYGTTLYTIQLGLNLAWMPLFFGLKRPIEATVDIVALWGINVYLTYLLGSIDKVSGYCLAPYVAWLSYATYLCAGAGVLNQWDFRSATAQANLKKA